MGDCGGGWGDDAASAVTLSLALLLLELATGTGVGAGAVAVSVVVDVDDDDDAALLASFDCVSFGCLLNILGCAGQYLEYWCSGSTFSTLPPNFW